LTGFHLGLLAISLAGFGVRFVYVWFFHRHIPVGGDSYFYHYGANLLVDGHGFIGPEQYLLGHIVFPSAAHPPLYLLTLAAASLVGLRSYTAHQLVSCAIGAGTVAMVGLAARETAGSRRAGLVAAALAAVYPFMWIIDGAVMSETDMLFTAALVVYLAYRMWHAPSPGRAVALGVAVGLAALTRAEEALLAALVLVPLALWLRGPEMRRRLQLAGIGVLATVVTVAPWCAYNLSRFNQPELLSTGFGPVLAVSYCDNTFYGQYTGWWWLECDRRLPAPVRDESDQDVYLRRAALTYAGHHVRRLPVVMFARLGRTFAFYRAGHQIFDDQIEQRPLVDSQWGLALYYAMIGPAAYGAVALRRRRQPLAPLLGLVASVVVVGAFVYGNTRFRAPADVALVILAGVGVDTLLSGRARRADEPGQPA